ncbi:MAG: tripartite tricarboxylate transporter substrate binding protein [Alcaligenaceae bacterium]
MHHRYRQLLVLTFLFSAAPIAVAQQAVIPSLIRIVVPFSPGASTDIIARAIAPQLGTRLGTSVIVENRPGGSTFIGAAAVAKAPQDGSWLLFSSTSTLSAAATAKSVPLDVVKDLTAISIIGEGPLVLAVTAKSEIKTIADFIAAARAKPNQLTNGSGGVGTSQHLAAELLNDSAKVQLNHIPYKGSAPGVIDLASGTIETMFATSSTVAPQVKAGRVRLIAVTSLKSNPVFPELPTVSSVVPGFELSLYTIMFAPAGIPSALLTRLNGEMNEIGKTKELLELMVADGAVSVSLTAEEAMAQVRASFVTYKKLAVDKNIVWE